MTTATDTHDLSNRVRGGNGRFRRTIETVDRDVQAALLHAQGASYPEIAAELGFADKGVAYRAVERALIERGSGERLLEARQARLMELDALRAEMWKLVFDPPPVVSRVGKIVVDPETGKPVPDAQVAVAAASTIIRASERTSRLSGLDAPKRTHMSIDAFLSSIPPADLRDYIQRLREELGASRVDSAIEAQQSAMTAETLAERRRALQQALADLDAEAERQAIPVLAESA